MTTKEQEIEEMAEQLGDREAGVEDLFELYSSIETVYVEATKSLADEYTGGMTSNSTNQE